MRRITINSNFKISKISNQILNNNKISMHLSLPSTPLIKLRALNPAKKKDLNFSRLSNETKQDKANHQWKLFQDPVGKVWIKNFSDSHIRVDDSWLKTDEKKELHGGEFISFDQNKKNPNSGFDYVFCWMDLQSKNELKRPREDPVLLSTESNKKLTRLENSLQEELQCSICLDLLHKCATITQCEHSFCRDCLLKHLRNSLKCPLCKKKIKSITKNTVINNLIEMTLTYLPHLKKSKEDKQIDLIGNVRKDDEGLFHRHFGPWG